MHVHLLINVMLIFVFCVVKSACAVGIERTTNVVNPFPVFALHI